MRMRKNRVSRKAALAGLALGLAILTASPERVMAGTAGFGQSGPASETEAVDVNRLRAAQGASGLVVVIGNQARLSGPGASGTDASSGWTLDWYRRDETGTLQRVFSVAAYSGKKGMTASKEEGDAKTPEGVYSFSMAFGLEEDPGSRLPYHRIIEGDFYVDDSKSRYYNRLVNENEVAKDWDSAEHLIRETPHYNYGLVISYNPDCVPEKGSAIFLHCNKTSENKQTSGCVSIPEEYMKQILCEADADTKIVIVPEKGALAKY